MDCISWHVMKRCCYPRRNPPPAPTQRSRAPGPCLLELNGDLRLHRLVLLRARPQADLRHLLAHRHHHPSNLRRLVELLPAHRRAAHGRSQGRHTCQPRLALPPPAHPMSAKHVLSQYSSMILRSLMMHVHLPPCCSSPFLNATSSHCSGDERLAWGRARPGRRGSAASRGTLPVAQRRRGITLGAIPSRNKCMSAQMGSCDGWTTLLNRLRGRPRVCPRHSGSCHPGAQPAIPKHTTCMGSGLRNRASPLGGTGPAAACACNHGAPRAALAPARLREAPRTLIVTHVREQARRRRWAPCHFCVEIAAALPSPAHRPLGIADATLTTKSLPPCRTRTPSSGTRPSPAPAPASSSRGHRTTTPSDFPGGAS